MNFSLSIALRTPSSTVGNSAIIVSFVRNKVLALVVGGAARAGADFKTRSASVVCTVLVLSLAGGCG